MGGDTSCVLPTPMLDRPAVEASADGIPCPLVTSVL